jgi:phosphate transport system ATP-binding protein
MALHFISEINGKKKSSGDMEKLLAENINVFYGTNHVIKNVSISMPPNSVTAFIGPSGCGKSTFLRLYNRMNDYIDGFRKEGDILFEGKDIYGKEIQLEELRKKIGMVFQKPNPFPKSVYENVVFGLRIQGVNDKKTLDEVVEATLKKVFLWEEVKDDLKKPAFSLSGGQQQRLCIARTLAVQPSILLMDEPTSALDPISTAKLEQLIFELKKSLTIVIVTHNMQQAARVSDRTAFFYLGELKELNVTKEIFTNPRQEITQNYITGRFG